MIGSDKYKLNKSGEKLYEHLEDVIGKTKYQHICNPCITKDTWILTSDGPRQVEDLIGKEFIAIVNGERYKSTGFWSTGIKKIYEIKTDRGYSVKATSDHKFYVEISRKCKYGGGYNIINNWKELNELKVKDKLVLNNQRGYSWDGYGDEDLGWLLGEIVGDGGHNQDNNYTYLRFWGESQSKMSCLARDIIECNFKVKSDFGEGSGFNSINRCATVCCVALNDFASKFIESKTKQFLPSLEKETSSLFIKGFIRGFFDADGTVTCNNQKGSSIRLCQSDLDKLYLIQRMLNRFGIISSIYTNRRKAGNRLMPDSNRDLKEYYCKAQHELVIAKDNINEFYNQIGFNEPDKQDRLEQIIDNQKEIYKERFLTNIENIIPLDEEEVFDCTVERVHCFDANGFVSHNCGEISINIRGGYCLIGSLAPFHSDSLNQIKENGKQLIRFLIRANTMNAIYGDEVKRTNRVGIGMTGWHEFAWKFFGLGFRDLINESKSQDFWNFIQELRITVENEADRYSDEIGVNHPHTITTCKPDGSISKLYGLTEGCHLPAKKQYLRWVQFSNSDPLIEKYRQEGYPVKALYTYPNMSCVGFPTQPLISTLGLGDKLITCYEATLEEQFKWLMLIEKYWLGERGNQISYSLKINTDLYTLDEIRQTILKYQPQIRCCSYQPEMGEDKVKSLYEYMPEEEISEKEYNEIEERIKQSKMEVRFHERELLCSSGSCPL